jgi:hypothetical protein
MGGSIALHEGGGRRGRPQSAPVFGLGLWAGASHGAAGGRECFTRAGRRQLGNKDSNLD